MTFDDIYANCNKLKSLLVFETNIYSISTTVYSYNAVIMKALARTFKKHYYRSWHKLTSLFCEIFLKWILNLETVTKNAILFDSFIDRCEMRKYWDLSLLIPSTKRFNSTVFQIVLNYTVK